MAKGILPEGFRLTPETMLCFDIYATHHAVGQVYQPLLSELGLTYPQFLAMVVLWERDGQTVGDLCARLDLASSTLTPLIKRLESQGMLTRKRDTSDERKVRVHLTAEGRDLEAGTKHIPECIAEAFGLSLDEFGQLHEMLGRVRRSLKASAKARAA